VQQAYRNLEAFRDVAASPGWLYMRDLMRQRMTELTTAVMETPLTETERNKSIIIFKVLQEWTEMPDEQITTLRAFLDAKKTPDNDDTPP
jgi:hypothetical protein